MAGGVFLYAVMELASVWGRQDVFHGEGLKRAGPGRGESIYEVLVKGLDKEQEDKKVLIEIPVRERQYTEKEAEDLFDRMQAELETQMLSENDSLNSIRHNLN